MMQDKDLSWNLNKESLINLRLNETLTLRSPLTFSRELRLQGKPIQWDLLPWLVYPLKDTSNKIVFRKASQMGVSTYCILWTLWLCRTGQVPRGLIYWLPKGSVVNDFSTTKVDEFLTENADALELPKGEKYNVGLKYIYGVPTYWRGLESKVGIKSISADAAVYDEFDEADPSQVKQARQRLSFSTVKLERELSTPTIPDFGIDKRFQETDQCHFAFKCEACSTWNILEEQWPHCFKQNKEGKYYRACKNCYKELQISKGRWIQKQQSDTRGYQISQLYSPFNSPEEIMKEYQTTEFMSHFYNHVLGLPYLAASDRVTSEMVLNACDTERPMQVSCVTPTAMGIDVGSLLHVTVLSNQSGNTKMLYCGEHKTFEEIDMLMKKFNVKELVIDALPETRKSRELVKRNQYKAWICFYSQHQKGSYAWNEEERIVSVNRTESLDSGTEAMLNNKISFPRRSQEIEEFANHCANTAKTVEEDLETGSKRYVYKKLGPDHYRHSLNYAMIALSRLRSGSVTSVFR